jgi:alpha-tubulin suppressor-like RCC1 family protein
MLSPKKKNTHTHTHQVVAGWGHTAVLTDCGEVLICGRNLQGQLGLGDPKNFPKNERDHPYQVYEACSTSFYLVENATA